MPATHARIPYEGCPLCGSRERTEIDVYDCSVHPLYQPGLPREMRWQRCGACGHAFTDGYFAPAALELILSRALENQVPGGEPGKVGQQRYVWSRVVEAVAELRRPLLGGRWLDVGFGDGSLLATAAEFGYAVVGVDVREASCAPLRAAGFEVHACELGKFRAAEPFDVVSMADVLEHMPFPAGALQHARGLLREGGLLFVSMPNADSFVWREMTRAHENPYLIELEHYHNFGRERLYALLAESGFEPLRYGVSIRYVAGMEIVARRR